MSAPPLIELEEITFSYPGVLSPVLDRINLTLRDTQQLGLIGPNGCGKTTLFHCMMGLLKPQSGTMRFKGEALLDSDGFLALRKEIGLLFQDADDQLFSPTVIEDVAFGPLNLGVSPKEAAVAARQTLFTLGLDHLEERVTHHLSGGEKKLVSLATILAMQPRALFLDEPTNNLDPDTRERLIDIIAGLGLGFIIISHDYDFLAATCPDLAGMEAGRIVAADHSALHTHHHVHPHGTRPHKHGDL
ncbi:MAG: ABC transporter ATP-binding protein [Desulfofustis sp.]|nr:energy-coupling factor ABC transporter ATP-binding protein [Desulfofustis sp.]NNK13319.1 ABC transporter ATP-binding protein [Desulfofustis sp.]